MSTVTSIAILGLEAEPVTVEADVAFGVRAFNIVGLPDAAIKESKERIYSAIRNTGLTFPRWRVTINLAPADIKKQGPIYDLAVTLSILAAQGEFPANALESSLVIGELGLHGEVRSVRGALVAALAARDRGYARVFLPEGNAREALLVEGIEIIPVASLLQLLEHLKAVAQIAPAAVGDAPLPVVFDGVDFADVRGQEHAKRGLEIAAAGGHNVVLAGPPGAGKTLLARALPSILPEMTSDESLEVTKIFSVAGELPAGRGLVLQRPFRSPHHSCSAVALVGGGTWPRPGEVSLAHRGVLFLDEWPEFGRHALEHLRQPIEDGFVTVSRAAATFRFPAKFMLVAAMNPCPCGFADDPLNACSCSASRILNYKKKISGPLLDRMDLFVPLPRVEVDKLTGVALGEPSACIRVRVQAARNRQLERFHEADIFTNAEMSARQVRKFCELDPTGTQIIRTAVQKLGLSARGYTRTLKLARTIADLVASDAILPEHLTEALTYRPSTEK